MNTVLARSIDGELWVKASELGTLCSEIARLRAVLEILEGSEGPHIDYAWFAREALAGRDFITQPPGER